VRQALSLAIDRDIIVDRVNEGEAVRANQLVPEGFFGWSPDIPPPVHDPEGARRLLAEAGFPGGQGLPPITLLYNTAENHRVIAEALQQKWREELGIELKLENQEWKVYLDTVDNGDYVMSRQGLIMEPYDPSQFLKVFTSSGGFNRTGWSNDEYDRLYNEVMATADDAVRQELMQRMEAILTDEMPILPVYYYTSRFLMDQSVQGWKMNLLAMGPYEQVWLQ
jgi:oligopeptide transport system substrate-binding protein